MCDCELNGPEFYDVNIVRGRMAHKCCECLRVIPQAELQEVASGKWEGGFDTFRTCMLWVDMRNEMTLESWAHGYLIEEVSGGDHDHLESVLRFKERRKSCYDREVANR